MTALCPPLPARPLRGFLACLQRHRLRRGLAILFVFLLVGAPPQFASAAASTPRNLPAHTEADWLGRSRDDVVAAFGKPLSALQRGDTEILMYAKSVRIEIRGDEVVAYRAGGGAMIVAGDGTQYTPTERGRVQKIAKPSVVANADDEDDLPVATTTPAAPTASARPAAPAPAPSLVSKPSAAPAARPPVAVAPPARLPVTPATAGEAKAVEQDDAELGLENDEARELMDTFDADEDFGHPLIGAVEDLSKRGLLPDAMEEEKTDPRVAVIEGVVSALLRFGFAVLMLRIAIAWVELPCYMPDVCKVAGLYVVLREGMHGLINLGGHWEWIQLFRLDDVVSYFALMILLFKFKIALTGITALKIATMTKAVTYFLMLIAGVVFSFMMG